MRLAERLATPEAVFGLTVLTLGTMVLVALIMFRRRPSQTDRPEFMPALILGSFVSLSLIAIAIPFWAVARNAQLELSQIRREAQAAVGAAGGISRLADQTAVLTERLYEIQAEQITRDILSLPRYRDPRRLASFEAKIYSQSGEDGMIREILRRIGETNRFFVEFGSSSGQENNTVFLLRNGWRGFWIDGDTTAIATAKRVFAQEISGGRLVAMEAFVTAENIEELFSRAKAPAEFDLLSIDIDRNDYWVWRSIVRYRPRAVVIEYNANSPPGVEWVVPYNGKAWWDGTSYFGASLTALEILGRQKGYRLVGCNLAGVNAFFVRDDLAGDRFSGPYTSENHYEPARYALSARGRPATPEGRREMRKSFISGTYGSLATHVT